jgi:hypothetical protein
VRERFGENSSPEARSRLLTPRPTRSEVDKRSHENNRPQKFSTDQPSYACSQNVRTYREVFSELAERPDKIWTWDRPIDDRWARRSRSLASYFIGHFLTLMSRALREV